VGLGVLDNDNARVGRELDIPFYVNTGFLYLNLARARSIKFTEKVLHRCDGNLYTDTGHDQRGLNQVFSGTEILPRLDQTWNLQLPVPESLDVLPRGARVPHITEPFKPWTYT
jgi:lipopolysaccharide biosynthesis glycosyltransferase